MAEASVVRPFNDDDDKDAAASRRSTRSRRNSVSLANIVNVLAADEFLTASSPSSSPAPMTPEQVAKMRLRQLIAAKNGGWRYRVRHVLKDPLQSTHGRVYHYGMLAAIVGNFVPMMLETMDGPAMGGSDPTYPFLPSTHAYYTIEVLFTTFFAADFALKCIVAKRQRQFWTRLVTWMDVLAISPLFGSLAMQYGFGWSKAMRQPLEGNLKLLRLFRIVRVSYMLRNIDGMKVLRMAIAECIPPLLITLFFLITIVMMFATLLYYAEPCYDHRTCPFTDIFNAGYFAMVTVATVGYGDQVPTLENPYSVLTSVVVMIFGALYLAMPLAIIGIKYELNWLRFNVLQSQSKSTSRSQHVGSRRERGAASLYRLSGMATTAIGHQLPTDSMPPLVHHCYIQYQNLTKEALVLHAMVHAYINTPPDDILHGTHRHAHNQTLEKLHVTCKHAIQLYHKFMADMRAFQPRGGGGLPPGEERNRHPHSSGRSRTSSFTAFASDALGRAKKAIIHRDHHHEAAASTISTHGRHDSAAAAARTPIRRRLRHVLEHPETSPFGNRLNHFFYANVLLSVLMFYAETTPELQAYGTSSYLCHSAMAAYCSKSTRTATTDPGCYVWASATAVAMPPTKLQFDCGDASSSSPAMCFGAGWNYGSNVSTVDCATHFSTPAKVCNLRQCQTNHVPYIDMTLKWVYPESFFAVVFTVEFSLRLFATKRRGAFLRSPSKWLDIGAIVPFYAEMLRCVVTSRTPVFAIVPTFPSIMTVLPILKTLRVLKMGKHFKASSVLARTAVLTYRRLLIPLFFLFLGCVAAGALFYEIERGTQCNAQVSCLWWNLEIMTVDIAAPFPLGKRIQIQVDKLTIVTDMLRSTWLTVVTLTTVGYGDLKPRTPFGKLFDLLVMVFGSCYTAMPLSLVGGQFYMCYEQYLKQEKGETVVAPQNQRAPPPHARVLGLDDIDILKKCGVIVLLLDEMMQNMVKINHLSPHPAALAIDHGQKHVVQHHHVSLAPPNPSDVAQPHAFVHHTSDLNHGSHHNGVLAHRSSDLNDHVLHRRISGGGLATLFGRGPHRIIPNNHQHHHRGSIDENVEVDDETKLRRLRVLIQSASCHLTTILLQLTRVMEKIVTLERDNESTDDGDAQSEHHASHGDDS
ncbi:Aste57867_3579 [Aphanomyces stellatus]|uniref:Aste57867_3579 protein n=1 Tax=Aphanomyces stellatus TaxID=120398 RepID=A0A485KB22_9STRA|nr:hypothetical protein As57867_003568 [Aphanomyces stellatus]VFT80740.1 Aste57867_3579 [Aphanomyces stellatus]